MLFADTRSYCYFFADKIYIWVCLFVCACVNAIIYRYRSLENGSRNKFVFYAIWSCGIFQYLLMKCSVYV